MSTELAWCAGFYDGEGCAYLARTAGRAYARVAVGQNTRECLDRFAVAVGMGHVYGPYDIKVTIPFTYQLHGSVNVQKLFDLLKPWLGSAKREQFERVLKAAQPPRVPVEHCPKGHSIAEWGRSSGQCRKCKSIYSVEYNRRLYAKRRALGLTAQGKPRKILSAKSHNVRF